MSDEKSQITKGIECHYSTNWIYQLEPLHHWKAYWFQQHFMADHVKPGDEVLEIGPGSGFCSNYLRSWKVIVETLDMDEGKHPNIVANIIDYVPEKKYDHIIAFEVFEHIPYEQFLETLKRFKPYCKQIFLSIPVNKKALIKVHFELLSRWNINFQLDARRHRITEGHHFWEVDYKQYAVKKVLNDIKSRGYQLQNKAIDQYKLYLHLQS